MMRVVFALVCCAMLSGCVGSLAADIITAPVKVVGKAVDVVTYNQPQPGARSAAKANRS